MTRYERATDRSESEVLELVVDDAKKLAALAEGVERSRPFGAYRLYNVDVPPEQMYLYENDLFPLAYCEVSETPDGLSWDIQDDIWSCQYEVPELRSVERRGGVRKSGKMAKVSDPIESISLKGGDGSVSTHGRRVGGGARSSASSRRSGGSTPTWCSPATATRSSCPTSSRARRPTGSPRSSVIDREGSALEAPAKKGTSYFSYGKILFKPSAMKLRGRVHLDKSSSFVHRESGLEGFYEVSRVCRLPLHTASRASIGKALSSLQFYHATKEGILIPWKPVLAESFKSRAELLVADRGGFIFEPELGVHEGVGELDFSSLFPSIMMKKNISAETVRCSCCPDSANRIPELDWNVCERRPEGIVPKAVKIIVEKRMKYKRLEQVTKGEERARYESRRNALKWVGVATFGYLGFNNAKFGRIDAHIGVCAWDRKVLVDAARVAERRGFRVMHGIVDSLWLKREGAGEEDFERLRREIEAETKFADLLRGRLQVDRVPPLEGGRRGPGPQPVLRRVQGREAQGPRDRGEAARHAGVLLKVPAGDPRAARRGRERRGGEGDGRGVRGHIPQAREVAPRAPRAHRGARLHEEPLEEARGVREPVADIHRSRTSWCGRGWSFTRGRRCST